MELRNGEDEQRYIEGQVLIDKGTDIGGVNDVPDSIGFLGYLNTTLPGRTRGGHPILFLKDLFLLTFSLDKNNIGCPACFQEP